MNPVSELWSYNMGSSSARATRMYTGATSVCKEEDGVEIEMWTVRRITLWRTETELQTKADEGGPWEKLEVQTERIKWCTDVDWDWASATLRAKKRTET